MNKKLTAIVTLVCFLLTLMPTAAFAATYVDAEGIVYELYDDGTAAVVDGISSEGDIIIPDTVTKDGKNYTVTAIESGAFKSCSSLTSVKIPNSVTVIGNYAFYNCNKLVDVTIGNKVETIGDFAFAYCTMTKIVIPNSVVTIGERAFYNCNSLTEVTIGNKVETIGDFAFAYCTMTKIVIPNSVATVGSNAFYNCDSLTEVTIGTGLTAIGEGMFSECDELKSIVIPDSVTTIGNNAFNSCDQLADVTIGNKVETIGESAFYNCAMTEIVIPDSVTTLGNNVFASCKNLGTIIVIGDGPTTVGNNAYGGKNTQIGYQLTVEKGTGTGRYKTNTEVSITANTETDKHFVQWNGVDSSRFVNGTTTTSAAATFTMPAHDVTVTATFAEHNYTETKYDADYHWSACTCGLKQAGTEEVHSFTNACDTSCNSVGCGYTRTITHTPNADDGDCTTEVKCSVCNTVTTPANVNHSATGSNAATCTTKAKCDVCGTEFGDLLAHNYVMQNNTDEHWKQCTVCNTEEPGSRAVHSYNDAYDVSCNTCRYTRTVTPSIPPTPPAPTGDSDEFTGDYNYPVTISPSDNGAAVLSDSNAVEGESVTITTKPNSGYGTTEVIVTNEDGDVIAVTDLGNGQYEFTMPDCEVSIEVVYKSAITLAINDLYINVFGKTIKNDVSPIIVGDRTMLPIRVIAEALGADVDWDAETQKVTITKGDIVIELFIGETTAYVNGKAVQLDAAPFIDNNRTYLPVRFVSEYLGAVVHWDGDTRTVTVIPE